MPYEIEISCDTPEADQFLAWLESQGHDAHIGRSTRDYVDGVCTTRSAKANQIMNDLWSQYCNS